MNTFSQDYALPSLPVPELPATCAAVSEMLAPLVDSQALDAMLKDLGDFSRPGGDGERLQTLLVDHAAALSGNASWLRPFWDDMYLAWRDPLPIAMNYFFRFDAPRWGGDNALPRLVLALAKVLDRLATGTLEPEAARSGVLAMDQAACCLYTRLAGLGRDTLFFVNPATSHSISVICRGHFFLVPLRGADGALINAQALGKSFAAIREKARSLPNTLALGALGAAPREEAAALKAQLCEKQQNRLSLAALEKSLFTVCLDEDYDNTDEAARALLGGDAANRFFDKSLQIIASSNGVLGANFEHAGCDAAIWVYLLGCADALLVNGPEEAQSANDTKNRDGQDARYDSFSLLDWDITPVQRGRLASMRKDFARRLADVDVACRDFPEFGRDSLKNLATSPDAFLQAAFQLAQHQIFGRLRSSYEAVSVRGFAQGRTECARGSSGEALAFALALQKNCPQSKLFELYRQTERIHKARLQRCQRGLGIERHIYGLRAMWELHGKALAMPEPALFTNPAWLTLKHDALSTSGVGAPFIRFFGFGPVVADGFGIGYAPESGKTGLVVSAFRSSGLSAAKFTEAFTLAAARIALVLSNS